MDMRHNHDRLANAGIYVPQTGFGVNHAWLTRNIVGDKRASRRRQVLAAFEKECSHHSEHDLVISSEAISGFAEKDLCALHNYLSQFGKVTCVVSLRNQASLLQSLWVQRLRQLQVEGQSPADFFEERKQGLKYLYRLRRIENAFPNCLVAITLEEAASSGSSLLTYLLESAGVSPPELIQESVRNASPDLKTLSLLFGVISGHVSTDDGHTFHRKTHALTRTLEAICRDRFRDTATNLICPSLAAKMTDYFLEDNNRVAKRYFGRDTLFPEAQHKPYSDLLSITDFSPTELFAIIQGLFGVMLEADALTAEELKSILARRYPDSRVSEII